MSCSPGWPGPLCDGHGDCYNGTVCICDDGWSSVGDLWVQPAGCGVNQTVVWVLWMVLLVESCVLIIQTPYLLFRRIRVFYRQQYREQLSEGSRVDAKSSTGSPANARLIRVQSPSDVVLVSQSGAAAATLKEGLSCMGKARFAVLVTMVRNTVLLQTLFSFFFAGLSMLIVGAMKAAKGPYANAPLWGVDITVTICMLVTLVAFWLGATQLLWTFMQAGLDAPDTIAVLRRAWWAAAGGVLSTFIGGLFPFFLLPGVAPGFDSSTCALLLTFFLALGWGAWALMFAYYGPSIRDAIGRAAEATPAGPRRDKLKVVERKLAVTIKGMLPVIFGATTNTLIAAFWPFLRTKVCLM